VSFTKQDRIGSRQAPTTRRPGAGPTRKGHWAKWKQKWKTGGVEALYAKRIPGRPGSLSENQLAELAGLVRDHTPADYGFEECLWTKALIAALIEQRFGVLFKPDWAGKLMRRLGFTPQRPVYRADQRDPVKVADWRENLYPAIRDEAAQVGAKIYFGDEAHLRSDYHSGTTWAPAGITPVIQTTGKRESVSMISAIEQHGTIHFNAFTGTCNSSKFIEFCKSLLADDGGKVFLILDNSSIHRSAETKEFVASTEDRLKLFFLPGYSPILNPDEWVWKNVKADRAGRRAKHHPGDLFVIAHQALERLSGAPEIVRGFFRDPHLAYIHQ
jgi:transposase